MPGGGRLTEGEEFQPKIVGFLCNWCSYAGADLAGTSRLQYPPNIRIIRVMCSGRINPRFVLKALQNGADGVLVSGCHPGECHYIEGNYYTRRKVMAFQSLLEHFGIDPRRFRLSWVSAAEAIKFSDVVKKITAEIKELGPSHHFESPDKKAEKVPVD
jgi:coenzyme F420-reducing hydrogenase delta subunit